MCLRGVHKACFGLLALCCACLQAAAQPFGAVDETVIQLFSGVDQRVVAVGEPLVLQVELYVSPASEEATRRIQAALAQAHFAPALSGVELIRSEAAEPRVHTEEGLTVLYLERRFILRAEAAGRIVLPSLTFRYGTQTYSTPTYSLEAYEIDPAFFDTERKIFSVTAHQEVGSRTYLRTGSAFLVAPDAVVTSFHVVVDAKRVRLRLPNGRWINVRKAWSVDPVRDVAVLYIDPWLTEKLGLEPIQLAPMENAVADWREPVPGRRVFFTNGWARGLQHSTAGVHYRGTVLEHDVPLWVSANPVRPGDSGGPLLDRHGRAVGVISVGSVLYARRDVLREEICIATDFRPALGQRSFLERPRPLRTLLRDPAVSEEPHAHALRLGLLMNLRSADPASVKEAIEQLDATFDRRADKADLHFMRGAIEQVFGRMADAQAFYRQALDASEGYFPALYMLALHHMAAQDFAGAGRLFERMRQHRPYAHLATFGLAQSRVRRMRYAEAVPLLQEVLRYDPRFGPALFELAYCYLGQGDEVRARQIAVKLESGAPSWAERLRQMLRFPTLRPFMLPELPPAPVKGLPVS